MRIMVVSEIKMDARGPAMGPQGIASHQIGLGGACESPARTARHAIKIVLTSGIGGLKLRPGCGPITFGGLGSAGAAAVQDMQQECLALAGSGTVPLS
jgi:hypothetical protein